MGEVIDSEDLAPGVEPLTADEIAWVRSLERVLKRMPRRLLLIEIADGIQIVARAAAAHVELSDGNAQRSGILLGTVDNSIGVLTGVSG